MMTPLRFGSVSYLYNLTKDTAKQLTGPDNRVLFYSTGSTEIHTKTYLVTGQEDIRMVDHLLQSRDRFQSQRDHSNAQELNNSLYRFLENQSRFTKDTVHGWDLIRFFANSMLEKLD